MIAYGTYGYGLHCNTCAYLTTCPGLLAVAAGRPGCHSDEKAAMRIVAAKLERAGR